MTNPGDDIAAAPSTQLSLITRQLRAMLHVVEVMGLGQLTVSELLDQLDDLERQLAEEAGPDEAA